MRKSLIALSLLFLCLSGCNTFSGMGKDLQAGGKAITKAANDAASDKDSTSQTKTTAQ